MFEGDSKLMVFLRGVEAMEYTYGIPGPTTYDLGDEIIYSKVKWHMPDPPTEEQFNQAMSAYEMHRATHIEYREKRAAEYPKISDFVDAYYWERNGDPTLMNEWLAKCTQVKQKYPKPPKS